MSLKIKVSAVIGFNYKDKEMCKVLYSLIRKVLVLKVSNFYGKIIEIRQNGDELVINSIFENNLFYHNYEISEEGECIICQ
ncbi:MAG: hypothetical protein J6T10_13490 [Methanobrevibacter sp.]|nr:hypothetical protein [Methanobrevibacter sp.]